MRIVYKPTSQTSEVIHALSGLRFAPGEAREISDTAKVRFKFRNADGSLEVAYVNLVDDLLSNPNFKNADTGTNPTLLCSQCGVETTIDGFVHRKNANIVENDFEGVGRLCASCFDNCQKRITPDSIEIVSKESPKEL
jgi:hypothetical protein